MVNERTPLRKAEGGGPPYVFMTNPNKMYRKQIHQFQCFVCAVFLILFAAAVIISILHSVEEDTIDRPVEVTPVNDNSSIVPLLTLTWPISDKGVPKWQDELPSDADIQSALMAGHQSLSARDELEKNLTPLASNTASYKHQRSIRTSTRALFLSRTGYVMDVATKSILSKSNDTNKKVSIGRTLPLNEILLPSDVCGPQIQADCKEMEYRSLDGTCNNPKHPYTWGVAMQPFRRVLPPKYADRVSSPRVASNGGELPSAREVSVTIHRPEYRDDPKFTVMLAVWGQFLDHDITATALSQGKNGSTIPCCGIPKEQLHPECFPVSVNSGDPYFNATCLEFVRSAPAPSCSFGPREQLNQASSYIDGSVVYGNTPQLSQSLRTYQDGQLRMTITPDGRALLPISSDPNDGCNREDENAKGRYCFASGDARANENTHLTTMHLIMARQHNIVASQLAVLNPDWNDEKVFQETRKIVSAQMQHITYKEFLPVLLGPKIMGKLELNAMEDGYYKGYDADVDSTVSNNFATASFRFAHTLLPGVMKLFKNNTAEEVVELHKMLFDPYKLYSPGYLDSAVLGAMNTPLERMDNYFNKEVSEKLFKQPTKPCGLDLVSLNVQRGRDHGLPAYPEWREHCGLSKPSTFDDLKGHVDEDSLTRMSSLYTSVDDVDLYTGALSEYPLEGGMLGATLTCLITDQFKRLKMGDRYWYETPEQPQGFTPEQLHEIRKTSLASLICHTADNVTMVQPKVMESVGLNNGRTSCNYLPKPDLTPWADAEKQMLKKDTKPVSSGGTAAIGIKVNSGYIKSEDGSSLWDGKFPVAIPVSLFKGDNMVTVGDTNPPVMPVEYGHGIQWTGKLKTTAGKLSLTGSFSFPTYLKNTPDLFNFTVKWINGEFSLNSDLLWNNTDISSIILTDTYSSPIFFSEKSQNQTNKLGFVLVKPHLKSAPALPMSAIKLPLIIKGSYTPDKTIFYWNGNATVILPLPKTNSTEINKIVKLTSTESKLNTTKTRAGFKIKGGIVKLNMDDGSQENLWSGTFPVSIPSPIFNLKTSSLYMIPGPSDPLFYQHGIIWTATQGSPNVQGSFSIPSYNYTDGYNVTWSDGEFMFDVMPSWNMSLDGIIIPGMKYVSKIFFSQAKVVNTSVLEMIDDSPSVYKSNGLQQFVADSASITDGVVPATIILQGSFTPDKKIFYWSGDGLISIKISNKDIITQKTMLKSAEPSSDVWNKIRYGCTVTKGIVKVSNQEFNIMPPMDIPVTSIWSHTMENNAFLFTAGVSWSGTLTGTTLKGEFSIPQYIGNDTYSSVQWQNGTYSLELNPLWDTPLEELFVPGANYYSKVSFQGSKVEHDVTTVLVALSKESKLQALNSAIYVPVILQGQYSLSRQTFSWDGNLIMSFRNSFAQFYNFLPPKAALKAIEPVVPKTSLRISVTTGHLSVSPLSQPTQSAVWDGDFPVAIPLEPIIASYDSIPKVADAVWTGTVGTNNVKGSFSIPTYTKNGSTVWYGGNFSFDYSTQWNAVLNTVLTSEKKYTSKIIFKEIGEKPSNPTNNKQKANSKSLVNFAIDGQNIMDDAQPGTILLFGKFYSRPFYCPAFLCADQKLFYWSGDAVVSAPNQKFILTKALPLTPAKVQFGGQVVSGNINVFPDDKSEKTLWSGQLPLEMPSNIFSSQNVPTSKMFNIIWSGTFNSPILQGKFTFPQFIWTGITTDVNLLNGEFNLEIKPLWLVSFESVFVPGKSYTTQIYFQGDSKPLKPNYIAGGDFSTTNFVPIILQGNYSADKTTFMWTGNFIISSRQNVIDNEEYTKLQLKAAEDNEFQTSKPTKAPNPTKAPKPTKPPKPAKPTKLSISFTVISGNVWAGFEDSNATEVWNGNPPVSMTLDNVITEGEYTPTAQVTWSGSANKSDLEGTFTLPTHFKNGTITMDKNWSGNFSIKYLVKWSGDMESFVKEKETYTCRVLFKEFTQKSVEPNTILQATETSYDTKQKASKVDIDINELGRPSSCNLLLVGTFYEKAFYCSLLPFLCTDATIFTWNGEVIMTFLFPPAATTPIPLVTNLPQNVNKLMAVNNADLGFGNYKTQRKIAGKVLSGSLSAGLVGESKRTLWSGSIPAEIPIPVFWAPTNDIPDTEPEAYSHGAIWSGSVFGSTIKCTFNLPQYTSNAEKSSERWWYGDFSVHVQSLWDIGLGGVIIPGIRYYSKIVFRDIEENPTMNLLQSSPPTQDEINSAYKAPLILLGTYSTNRKTFYWSGNFILIFKNLPYPYMYDLPIPQPLLTSTGINVRKDIDKEKIETSKNEYPLTMSSSGDNVQSEKKIIGKVLSGSLTAGLSIFSKTTLWSGSLPVEIPLPVFWAPTTDAPDVEPDAYSHGAIWSATVFGSTVKCSFYLPQYTFNGVSSSMRWWKGDLSVDVQSLWDSGLAQLITSGFKYYSKIIFRDSKNTTDLLKSTPTQDDINSAFKAPLILLGSYSNDRKTFYWSGDFILVFQRVPNALLNDFTIPLHPTLSQSSATEKVDKATITAGRSKSVTTKSSLIGTNKQYSYQGEWLTSVFPAMIPLNMIN